MTKGEFDKLIEARNYIVDAEYGCYNIEYYRSILNRLKDHKKHGTQSISCTIHFIQTDVMIDADILIKIYEDKIAEMEKKVADCHAFIDNAVLIIKTPK